MPGGASGAPQVAAAGMQQAGVGMVKPQASAGHGPPPREPVRYRVMNGGTIVWHGCRTPLRAGKEISDAQYDITLLKRQGIRLARIDQDGEEEYVERGGEITRDTHGVRRSEVLVPGSPEAISQGNQWEKERKSAEAWEAEKKKAKAEGREPDQKLSAPTLSDPKPQFAKA